MIIHLGRIVTHTEWCSVGLVLYVLICAWSASKRMTYLMAFGFVCMHLTTAAFAASSIHDLKGMLFSLTSGRPVSDTLISPQWIQLRRNRGFEGLRSGV